MHVLTAERRAQVIAALVEGGPSGNADLFCIRPDKIRSMAEMRDKDDPELGQGEWASIITSTQHLRVHVEYREVGWVWQIYDMKTKVTLSSGYAESLEDGKAKVVEELGPLPPAANWEQYKASYDLPEL